MLPEKLRSFFHKPGIDSAASPTGARPHPQQKKEERHGPPITRQSRGLEQFFFNLRDLVGLSILDLAGANQENINFLTSLGHKVYSQDLVRNLDEAFGSDLSEQTNISRIEYFLNQNFDYPPGTFEGVLLWDSLQFMSPALLNATLERLHLVMTPKSYLLTFFNAMERPGDVPSYAFRIIDNKTLTISERGMRPAGQVFNNRNLEKVFTKFDSVKFFLTRESLREVIVKR